MYGYKPEEGIRSALKHGTLAIGQLGLAETLQILIGKDHTTEEGMQLAIKIETLFKEKCAKFKKEHKLNWNICTSADKMFVKKKGNHVFFVKTPDSFGNN